MSQKSLFDRNIAYDADPTQHGRGQARKEDTEDDVAKYNRRKRRQELRERQERNTLHRQATRSIGEAGKLYCLLWALETRENHPDLVAEMRRAAYGVKNRLKSFAQAQRQNTSPGDPEHIGLGEQWPYDDEFPPEWHTTQLDYQRWLVDKWFEDCRHLLPTDVLEKAEDVTDRPTLS